MHKPGDTPNCYVAFDRQTDFTSVYLLFSTPVGAVVQSGLCNGSVLKNAETVDSRSFRISGVVPWCTSATYVLAFVVAHNAKSQVGQYRNTSDFSSESIELRNTNRTLFPDIADVSSEPPRN
jgi:hypothetical protein